MLAETVAGIGAFKTMIDIAKTMKDMDTATERNAAVIALQEKIFSAHATYASLADRVRELEAEVARFKTWETEKQRYELEELPPGIFAYRVKAGHEHGEPAHKVCATCFNKSVKSLLHNLGTTNGLTHWKCHSCGFDETSGHFVQPQVNRSGDWRV